MWHLHRQLRTLKLVHHALSIDLYHYYKDNCFNYMCVINIDVYVDVTALVRCKSQFSIPAWMENWEQVIENCVVDLVSQD